jgi:hypothetical protein
LRVLGGVSMLTLLGAFFYSWILLVVKNYKILDFT